MNLRHAWTTILLLAGHVAAGCHAGAPRRPNFLFILVDDQTPFELSAYNPATRLETPVLDRLAARGMIIDAAHHMGAFMGAVCTPSRYMIMCGRSLWHLPIGPGRGSRCPDGVVEHTLPMVFNRAGYATMRTGKVGNSYDDANRRFSVLHEATKREGNDRDGSAWHAERVLDFLLDRANAADRRPFFIELGFSHPHDPRNGKPELLEKYGADNLDNPLDHPALNERQPPLPLNYLPAHPFSHGHPNLRDEVDVSGVWRRRDEATVRNENGREFACAENIDRQIGRVLDELDAMKELENTYVVYASDHGIALGRHGLMGKQNLYEHTWRVPLIVAGPGIRAGGREPGNVYLLDLLATFCDLADIAPPESNEGVSFKPVLLGQRSTVREVLYGVYSGGTQPGIRCVKRGTWKLIKYDVLDGRVRQTQLFNLEENPNELIAENADAAVIALTGNAPTHAQRNLAHDSQYSTVRSEMEALLEAEMQRLDDPARLWDQPR